MSSKVTLVGAGLVGSLLSIFLAKKGHQVEVFERRPDYRKMGAVGGRSINLALSERGWRALKAAGIEQKIKDIALPMRGRMMHDIEGNLTFQPYGKENQAIYSVSRAILNEVLMDVAEKEQNVKFHFNQRCENIDIKDTEATFLNEEEQTKNRVKSDIVIGADGAFSAVRGELQKMPLFNYTQHYLPHGYKELTIPPNEDGSHKLAPDALHIWPRRSFMLIALPNTDGSFTCTLFLRFESDKEHQEAFDKLTSDEEIISFFETHFADVIPIMPTLLEDFKQNPTSSLVTIRCAPWAYQGKVCLIGDASHAIVPFYGQGMNSGFEDCFYFNEFMEKQLKKNKNIDWQELFSDFQEERIPNTNAIADLAIQNFIEMRDRVADPEFLLRKKIEAKLHEQFPSRWIPQYTMVTFSHLPYSYALNTGKKQEQIMNEIMKKEDIENNWQNLDWESIVEQLQS
ncbi:FAD-dependent oxidoreductase [Bernardetia sp.]|uniref:FAD-dependent oxidoreductase n=1 Tax=Bernardetia sp. TaxID=1937974 RepID=UPI0025BD432C|nr:NAD(P)/FAD-dependent oxidoreductase [Bernardetia sp.]